MQFTYVNCKFTGLYNHHNWILEHFRTPIKKPVPINSHSPFSPNCLLPSLVLCPTKLLCIFLSLWTFLFWKFHMNGILQCVVFCDWHFSLGIMFLRFIYLYYNLGQYLISFYCHMIIHDVLSWICSFLLNLEYYKEVPNVFLLSFYHL